MRKWLFASMLLVAHGTMAVEHGQIIAVSDTLRSILGLKGNLEVLKQLDRLPNGIEVFVAMDSQDPGHIPMLFYRLPDGTLFYGLLVSKDGRVLSLHYARAFQQEADNRLLELQQAIRIPLHDGHTPLPQRAVLFVDMSLPQWRESLLLVARALSRDPWRQAPVEIYIKPTHTPQARALLAYLVNPDEWTRRVLRDDDFAAWADNTASRATNAETRQALQLVRSSERVMQQLGIPDSSATLLWHTRKMTDIYLRSDEEIASFLDDSTR